MGRGKLNMEMIGDQKTRCRTFWNRSKGLKKKLHELSTLCDVDACMIVYPPHAADGPCSSRPDFWPENRDQVECIINRYFTERKEVDRKRTLDLSDVLGSRKTEAEVDQPEKLKEKNGKSEGRTSGTGIELEGLSYEKLMELLEKLDKKIADVDSRIDLKKKEAGLMGKAPPANCSRMPPPFDIVHAPMANPVLQGGSELVLYDQDLDFPDLSSGAVERDFKNWMMMMDMEKQEHQEFGGGRILYSISEHNSL